MKKILKKLIAVLIVISNLLFSFNNAIAATTAGQEMRTQVLYLADINGGLLSVFLDQLKRKKASVDLKAVKTETNVNYTAYELYKEISAEREAIARGKSAH